MRWRARGGSESPCAIVQVDHAGLGEKEVHIIVHVDIRHDRQMGDVVSCIPIHSTRHGSITIVHAKIVRLVECIRHIQIDESVLVQIPPAGGIGPSEFIYPIAFGNPGEASATFVPVKAVRRCVT